MFFSSGCMAFLLYAIIASLAATAIPSPISMSDTLTAVPLRLPNNSTEPNNNITQEQLESLQLIYTNRTTARCVEIAEASPWTI